MMGIKALMPKRLLLLSLLFAAAACHRFNPGDYTEPERLFEVHACVRVPAFQVERTAEREPGLEERRRCRHDFLQRCDRARDIAGGQELVGLL